MQCSPFSHLASLLAAFVFICTSISLPKVGGVGFGLGFVVFFLKGEEIATKIQGFVYLFPVGGKNSGGLAGSYPMRSKETRFVVKIEGIFGRVVRSLLIATYHDFQLSHLVGRRQVLFNSSSTMC